MSRIPRVYMKDMTPEQRKRLKQARRDAEFLARTRFIDHCLKHGLPAPEAEYRFSGSRKWRFDYAWPATKVALEIEGGAWTRGRHTRGAGFVRDMEKYNAAVMLGWRIIRIQPKDLYEPATVEMVRRTLGLL